MTVEVSSCSQRHSCFLECGIRPTRLHPRLLLLTVRPPQAALPPSAGEPWALESLTFCAWCTYCELRAAVSFLEVTHVEGLCKLLSKVLYKVLVLFKNLYLVFWLSKVMNTHWKTVKTVCAMSLQSCLTLYSPVDYSPPGSSVRGIVQARILQWVAVPSSRESSWPRGQTSLTPPVLAGGFFTASAMWEAPYMSIPLPWVFLHIFEELYLKEKYILFY